jgi:hypothetical protein
MDFWSWKLVYVTLVTMKWMDFGLVLWWTLKKFRGLVLILKCNNEIKIERFWFISNEMYELWTFIWWKTNTFFSKVHYILKEIKIMLKFNKNVLINALYTGKKISMEKNCLKSMHYCYLITKTISRLKKNTKEMDPKWTFKFVNSCHFLVQLTMHLPYQPIWIRDLLDQISYFTSIWPLM